jgi:hypothetical protein
MTVAPLPNQPPGISAQTPPDLIDCFTAALRSAADSVPSDVGLTTRVLRGNPAEVILRTAHDGDYDIVVMGSHGHGRLHRALLGSVSYRVLHDSPVPVLLIRRGASGGPVASVASDAIPDRVVPSHGI